ncbi:MAG: TolC family protein, partial [Parabacteroides sp.]|nr:TolC family protein [Parabacteroides sp.]
MKTKQLFYTACAAVCLSSCHIYKAYERPEQLETDGLFRDPETGSVLLSADTTTMANLPWQELFRDPKL